MSKKDDLNILLPDHELTINGEEIVIRPFSFAKLPKVIALLSRIGVSIFELIKPENGLSIDDTGLVINDRLLEKLTGIVEEHFADVAELMSIYCNKPKEYFFDEENGPNGEDGFVLLLTIIERNYNFFTKRLRPILAQISLKRE